MQEFPLLNLEAFRNVLERWECRWSVLAEEPDGTLYAIERGEGDDLKFAVIHIWEPTLPVPYDVIRSVCAALGLGPGIFGLEN
jgi:hypothetical protein